MDVLKEVLKTVPDNTVQIDNVEVRILTKPDDIGKALNSKDCGRSDTLCIGAAAISITSKRMKQHPSLSFLVSYHTSHLRLLRSEAKPRATQMISSLANSFSLVPLGVVLLLTFFLLIMTLLVWCLEMLQHGDKVPIFTPAEREQETEASDRAGALLRSLTALFEQCKLLRSFVLAARWTLGIFLGARYALPHSALARGMHPILITVRRIVILIASATLTAVFTQFAISSLTAPKLQNLTAADTVCSNKESTANTNFVLKMEKSLQFEIVPCESREDMFDKYFNEACNVIIYDDLLLKGELKRRKNQQPQDTWDLRLKRSIIGDENLNFDPYGMWMNNSHWLYTRVNKKLIDVARDLKFREETLSKYLKEDSTDSSETAGLGNMASWHDLFVVGIAIVLSVLVGVSILVHSRRKELEKKISDVRGNKDNPIVDDYQQVHNIYRLVVELERKLRTASSAAFESRGPESEGLSAAEDGTAAAVTAPSAAATASSAAVPPAAAETTDLPAATLTPEDGRAPAAARLARRAGNLSEHNEGDAVGADRPR